MKSLGYETAYFGKFELRRDIIYPKDTVNYMKALVEYGFDSFPPDGDKTGKPDQAPNASKASIRGKRTRRGHRGRSSSPSVSA